LYLKIHDNPAGKVVAVCDAELIGKILKDENGYMDLEKYRSFYVGEKADEGKVKKALGSFDSANLVGKKVVGIALDMGLASSDDVNYINRIPYIQLYKI